MQGPTESPAADGGEQAHTHVWPGSGVEVDSVGVGLRKSGADETSWAAPQDRRWPPASTALSATATRVYLLMCVVLVATAALLVGRYFAQTPPPPAPPGALGAIPAAMTAPSRDGALGPATPAVRDPQAGNNFAPVPPAPTAAPPFSLPPSPPVSVRSPAVGIDSTLGQVGLNTDGTIEVPTSYDEAAWYRLGPPPGALGPAVIIGHVDSYKGPSVFFNLGDMQPG